MFADGIATQFRGWPEDAQRFFIGLELDNSKRFFDANRHVYEDAVKAPMVALIESLESDYGPGKVFRANRDIRFSKDKSPYKTNIAGYAGMCGNGGYISLDARGLTVASGRYEFTPEQLSKYRKKVAADSTGAPLAAIVAKLEKSGYEIGGEELKRVPTGWPQDHPRERLLRRKLLYVSRNFGLKPWLGSLWDSESTSGSNGRPGIIVQ
ncbi:MAG TPA: DUF2461 domain-containing protein [Candidatus Dormibacteraeota bacterium]|jgi:uncharacterized protein (TIGR02453 family)